MKRVFFAAAAVAVLSLSSCSIAAKYVLENASGSEIALLFRGAITKLAPGERSKPLPLAGANDRLEITSNKCTYFFVGPDWQGKPVPKEWSKDYGRNPGEPEFVFRLAEDFTLHAYRMTGETVAAEESFYGGFPLSLTRTCGQSSGRPDR
jgi:hypothetical protein